MAQLKNLVLLLFLQIISLEWTAEAAQTNSTKTAKFYKKKVNRPLNATTTSPKLHRSLDNPDPSVDKFDSSVELDQLMLSEDFDDLNGLDIIDPTFSPTSSSKYLTSQV